MVYIGFKGFVVRVSQFEGFMVLGDSGPQSFREVGYQGSGPNWHRPLSSSLSCALHAHGASALSAIRL